MTPTCSNYAKESFEKDQFILAWLKTSDRLVRCSNDPGKYHLATVDGMLRFYDPVQKNYSSISTKPNIKNISLNKKNNVSFTIENEKKEAEADDNVSLLYQFAYEMKLNGELDKALVEYRRLLSYYPNSKYKINAITSICDIYYKQKEYIKSIKWAKKILNENNKNLDKSKANYFIAISYFQIENYKMAREYFLEARKNGNNLLNDKTYLLEGLTYILEEKWGLAKNYFSRVRESSIYYEKAKKFSELSDEGKNLKLKNPTLSGVLSVVPGLGYLYNDYKQTALSSLFVNSLFMWAASESFENDNEGLGYLLSVFSIGFYSGNIYGSVHTAEDTNYRVKQEHILKFQLDFNNNYKGEIFDE